MTSFVDLHVRRGFAIKPDDVMISREGKFASSTAGR